MCFTFICDRKDNFFVGTGLIFYERKNKDGDAENFLFEDIVALLFINFRPAVRFIPKNGIPLPSGLLISAAGCLLPILPEIKNGVVMLNLFQHLQKSGRSHNKNREGMTDVIVVIPLSPLP
jgi:hypothetical protein